MPPKVCRLDGDDDMLTAMARELVENKGIGESADSVWRALGQLRPSSPVFCFEEPKNEPFERSGSEIPSILPLIIDSNPTAVMEGGSLARRSSRKLIEQGQLSLF